MRREASKFSKNAKNESLKEDKSKIVKVEEIEDWNKCNPRPSGNDSNSDNEEPEEDPDANFVPDTDEDPEELEENSDMEPEEDPEEELEEDTSERLENDSNEDLLEEDQDEDDASEEDQVEDHSEEDSDEDPSEEDPEEDPSEEEQDDDPSEDFVSVISSERNITMADHSHSNDKQRSVGATVNELASCQALHSQKKHRRSRWDESGMSGSACEGKKLLDSSGLKRQSRWEPEINGEPESGDRDENNKRKKTRWDTDGSKMLDLLNLPYSLDDFIDIQRLQVRLHEINEKLRNPRLQDEKPEEERSPSPESVYNNLGIRLNTREVRLRQKLLQERIKIMVKLGDKTPTFRAPESPNGPKALPVVNPAKLAKKIYIPVKEFPGYNFIGLIMGPGGKTQLEMEKETRAKIYLRGKGSRRKAATFDASDNEDLHVLIEATSQSSMDAATAMIEKLLVPQDDKMNFHKQAQLVELAKMKGTYNNVCSECKEEGHRAYACPNRQSTLNATICCDRCGSFSHGTPKCPLTVSSNVAKPSSNKKTIDEKNLYIASLPVSVDDSRLREIFSPFGKITSSIVMKDQNTGLSKGYGFVKFENAIDAATAVMSMKGYQIDGNRLQVRVAGIPPHLAVSPAVTPRPVYPGLVPVQPGVPNQIAWLGHNDPTILGVQVSSPGSVNVRLPQSSTSLGNANQFPVVGSPNLTSPSVVYKLNGSSAAVPSYSFSLFPGVHAPVINRTQPSLPISRNHHDPTILGVQVSSPGSVNVGLLESSTSLGPSVVSKLNGSSAAAPSYSFSQFPGVHAPGINRTQPSPPISRNQLPSAAPQDFASLPIFSALNKPKAASPDPSSLAKLPGRNQLSSAPSRDFASLPLFSAFSESKAPVPDPSSLAKFPGDPDYRGSGLFSDFTSPSL